MFIFLDFVKTEKGNSAARQNTISLSQYFLLSVTDFLSNKTTRRRSLGECKQLLSKIDNECLVGEQMLQNYLMLKSPPVWHHFSFVRVHQSIEVYAIFRFEPMHLFSLGLSKMPKERFFNYLSDQYRTSLALTYQSG